MHDRELSWELNEDQTAKIAEGRGSGMTGRTLRFVSIDPMYFLSIHTTSVCTIPTYRSNGHVREASETGMVRCCALVLILALTLHYGCTSG